VSVECVTRRAHEDMSEHSCYVYEVSDLVRALTVRIYYHKTRVTARVMTYSRLDAEAWRPFERALSERLSRVMPKPSEDRVVNRVLSEFLRELIVA